MANWSSLTRLILPWRVAITRYSALLKSLTGNTAVICSFWSTEIKLISGKPLAVRPASGTSWAFSWKTRPSVGEKQNAIHRATDNSVLNDVLLTCSHTIDALAAAFLGFVGIVGQAV